jgi:4a-hydroxytetrahydrobiopterin dehydratase
MKNSQLHNLKCSSCNKNTPKLKKEDIYLHLKKLDLWNINDEEEMIFKKFTFSNFNKSLNFTNSIAFLAENESHHPDISLGWGYCIVMLHTHAIKALSLNDFILASKIDNLKY